MAYTENSELAWILGNEIALGAQIPNNFTESPVQVPCENWFILNLPTIPQKRMSRVLLISGHERSDSQLRNQGSRQYTDLGTLSINVQSGKGS